MASQFHFLHFHLVSGSHHYYRAMVRYEIMPFCETTGVSTEGIAPSAADDERGARRHVFQSLSNEVKFIALFQPCSHPFCPPNKSHNVMGIR